MEIKFLDLNKINARFETEFKKVFNQFLNSGYYILGSQLKTFEQEFAVYCDAKYCVGVGNGYDALFLILRAYIELGKLNKGDEVIVAANTYIATILAIKNVGLIPVLVDPNKETYNLDPELLDNVMSLKTKAILVTHLYGQLADMDRLSEFSNNNNLLLLADAAQAHGAINNRGNRAGSLADASAFSFYPTKNLGALGDGGAVTTNDKLLVECIDKLRNYGRVSKFENELLGVNSRLDELQAGILRVKLKYLDKDNQSRREIAKRYISEINNTSIKLPYWDFSKNHVFHVFVIQVKDRAHFCNYLTNCNIEYSIHYPILPHKQEAFKTCFVGDKHQTSENLVKTIVSLPISPVLEENEVTYVVESLNKYEL